jgi:AmmeMemoRadiSam system protein B
MKLTLLFIWSFIFCSAQTAKVRTFVDTVGFAHTAKQMDTFMQRVLNSESDKLKEKRTKAGIKTDTRFKTVISPHDDYTYCGYMYPLALENVKAKTIILFGVAHKARNLDKQNKIVFESYDYWKAPYGNVKVSALRNEIISELPKESYEISDTLQKIEHSLEAEMPFLQYYNKHVEIIPILAPPMSYDKITELGSLLAKAIAKVMKAKNLKWGSDIAIVVSADAVHYGNEDWGGRDFAFYGADSAGYKKAVDHEMEIYNTCFTGELNSDKVKAFTGYTVKEDYKDYKWTWCGRYSVPLGLQTSYDLAEEFKIKLKGSALGYETSLSKQHIKVSDLGGMATTAKATIKHWVGYPAIGFK